ncbi:MULTISPECIES: hypothetical protein [unclassified Streptomyces]|uniref:hypothetical protein n=1 Tax=unclassified Streptomyces TaxID=2593676 RepID=UPI00380D3C51
MGNSSPDISASGSTTGTRAKPTHAARRVLGVGGIEADEVAMIGGGAGAERDENRPGEGTGRGRCTVHAGRGGKTGFPVSAIGLPRSRQASPRPPHPSLEPTLRALRIRERHNVFHRLRRADRQPYRGTLKPLLEAHAEHLAKAIGTVRGRDGDGKSAAPPHTR